MIKKTTLLLITILLAGNIFSQDNKQLQNTFLEAEYFFMNEEYSEALNLYLQIYNERSDNANIAFQIGVCCLNIPGRKEHSLKYLESAVTNMSAKHKEGTVNQTAAPYDALYELARAYRINYNFDKARETFLKYKGTLLPDDKENIEFIDHEISVCETAKTLMSNPISYTEENAGELFNDEKPNFNPLISADNKTFAYMSSLKFYDAIMVSHLENNKWSGPVNIYPDIQLDGDLSISSLSKDGKTLYISKDDNSSSDIYTTTYNGTAWSAAIKLNKNINTKYWESHACISEDGSMLIFASDRPGGFGGLDLYVSRKVNGEWGPALNLGPEINTIFNDDRPFLGNHDKILFFSSQGHNNMGGYDMFSSTRLSNGQWDKPVNMGYPLNTPDDNSWFMPVNDGRSGYIFEDKEAKGYGKDDIYKIMLK
jgi:tetratricopeptide (TPR) repeat protein